MNPNAKLANSLPPPLLDRVLGSKLLELSKGTRFAMQTVQEEAQKLGCQPKGRHLLWTVFEKFKMERKQAAGARKLQWIIVLQIRVVYVGVHVLS